MKIALIHPPYTHKIFSENLSTVDDEFSLAPPIILAYIAAIIENQGHEVLLIDARTLELSKEKTAQMIKDFNADLLGFRAETYHFHDALDLIRYLKADLNIPVFSGGVNFSLYPEESISHEEIDFGITGNALNNIPVFLKAFEQKRGFETVQGLIYKTESKKTIFNKNEEQPIDFERFPYPARHLLPNEKYYSFISQRKNFTIMLTSIGCPFKCSFCAIPSFYSVRSAQKVIEEIKSCYYDFNVREIDFFDAVFFMSRERDISIMKNLKQLNLDLEWSCRSRVDLVDKEMLELAAASGCRQIYYGIESVNSDVLSSINKNIARDKIVQAIYLTKKAGIKPMGFFMVGNPNDTVKSIRESIEFAKELDLDFVQVCRAIAKPGTQLHKQLIEKTGKDAWREHVKGNVLNKRLSTPWTSLTEIEKESLTKEFYLQFYFRSKLIRKRIFQLKSLSELKRYIKVAWKMILQKSEICLHVLTDTKEAEKLIEESKHYKDKALNYKVAVVLPTLNEEENIAEVIENISNVLPQAYIVVVDDNSSDGTCRTVEQLSKKNQRIKFILRKNNPGLGRSYIEGFQFVLENLDVDYVCQMDADLSHNTEYLPLFLHYALTNEVVAGSRFLNRVSIKNRSLSRNIISKTTKWFFNFLLGMNLSDVTTGFKCFRKSTLAKLDFDKIKSLGYAFQIEVAYMLNKKKIEVKEVPILFFERTKGKSKMSGKIMLEGLMLIIRLHLSRLKNLINKD